MKREEKIILLRSRRSRGHHLSTEDLKYHEDSDMEYRHKILERNQRYSKGMTIENFLKANPDAPDLRPKSNDSNYYNKEKK